MRLILRPPQICELAECAESIRDGFLYDERSRPRLIAMWRDLIAQRMAQAAVVDDLDETFGRRIVSFGIGVFVTPEFAAEVSDGQHPYISSTLVELWKRDRSPILDYHQIAEANAGPGLHMLNFQSGYPDCVWTEPTENVPPSDLIRYVNGELAMKVLSQNENHVAYAIGGFRLNEVIVEAYGHQRERTLGRFFDRGSCAEALARRGLAPRVHQYPYVMGLNATEAGPHFGTMMGAAFNFSPPIFGFTYADQELLHLAVGGLIDVEIADWLSISHAAVRKRWTSIFDHVSAIRPRLFNGHKPSEDHPSTAKRRVIVQYIQSHPEELRPWPKTH